MSQQRRLTRAQKILLSDIQDGKSRPTERKAGDLLLLESRNLIYREGWDWFPVIFESVEEEE